MAMPTKREIEIPLLHLVNSAGGEAKPKEIYEPLADYFKLTRQEREELLPNTSCRKFENRVQWARWQLVNKGFLDNAVRGVWKITEKGKQELAKYGLLNKSFPNTFVQQKSMEVQLPQEQVDFVSKVISEVLPDGVKKFPDDFLDSKENIKFREINIPGTLLQLDQYYRNTVVSPKGYFRYQAKNPPEALYIVYSNHIGRKIIEIPEDNLIVFRAVKLYEKYIKDLETELFQKFLELTYDESKAENLVHISFLKLGVQKVWSDK